MIQKLSEETLAAIASIESNNPEFIQAAMPIFDSGFLPDEFTSSDVVDALIKINVPQPTDWRVMGPLIRRAISFDIIEITGNSDVRRSITGHTSNHLQPTYRVTDPIFRVPTKMRRKAARKPPRGNRRGEVL
jgi:hypothetical protein